MSNTTVHQPQTNIPSSKRSALLTELNEIKNALSQVQQAVSDVEMKMLAKQSYKVTVIAVVVSLFTSAFAVAWSEYASRRDILSKEAAAITAFKNELLANGTLLNQDNAVLDQEIRVLAEKKHAPLPLGTLETDGCELVRVVQPKMIYTNPELLSSFLQFCLAERMLNQEINSRETYALHNEPMSNYHEKLRIYDDKIISQLIEMGKLNDELYSKL